MSSEIAQATGARSADGLFAGVHGTVLHIDDSPELLGITEEYITGQLPQYKFIEHDITDRRTPAHDDPRPTTEQADDRVSVGRHSDTPSSYPCR